MAAARAGSAANKDRPDPTRMHTARMHKSPAGAFLIQLLVLSQFRTENRLSLFLELLVRAAMWQSARKMSVGAAVSMTDLGEILDPVRKHVIDIKDALVHARYRYDGLDLILETVADSKIRGASQEIFALAGETMNAVDDMLDELYRQLSDLDRKLEALARSR